jgi:peptidyl-Asp metalloendopeptidase
MHRTVSHRTVCRPGRLAWLALLGALIALAGTSGRAQQGQGRARHLFEPRGQAVADTPDGRVDRTRKRGRRVRANADALRQADTAGGNDILTLNLFDDVQLRARQSRIERTLSGGTVWKGTLLDVAGEATFAVTDGVIAGTIFAGDKVFEVLYAGSGEHEVREIDPAEFPTDDPHADPPPVTGDPQAQAEAAAIDAAIAADMAPDAASQIDVMVIWTPAARSAAGGSSAIQSVVDLAVANTNSAYGNSGVTQRVRLVYSGELAHTESGISTDLSRMVAASDGFLDQIPTMRNTYGADVVTLLGEGYTSAGACGLGYLMTSVSASFAGYAFNVVDRTCAAGNLSYAHELGHNMGLHHDPANASGSPAYSYAYGYQHPQGLFRTVMAYACPSGACPRVLHFANPSVNYSGMPTGTASQNTALALNNTAPTVANFRQAVSGSCSYSLGASSISVGSGAAQSSVSVTAGSGCSWTASSNVAWITFTSGASGTGNGTVGYTVAANSAATARTGVIAVAGRTLTITQTGAPCAYSLSPASASVSGGGASGSVTLTTMSGCTASAISSASWLTVTSGATGSASRTVTYTVAANTGTARSAAILVGGQTFTVNQSKRPNGSRANSAKADFTGDSMADLLWQHQDGAVGLWKMNGISATETVLLTPGQVDPVWKMVGSGDLDGDDKPEIVWQHQTGGWLCAWFMTGTSVQQVVFLNPNRADTNEWKIAAVADINGDAKADLIWQHHQGGLVVWYMNGATRIGSAYLNPWSVAGNDWKIVGAGDVNGDLKPDLIWQQSSGGLLGAWLMNGVTATSMVLLNPGQVSPNEWTIRAVVDLDGDGHTDLVWQHYNGGVGAWLMNGTTATSMQLLQPASVPTGWRLVGPK